MRMSDWSSDVCSSDLLAPLDAEALRHDDDQRIALLGADHGEADAGVAAGRLDHRLPRTQRSPALGILDDAEGEAVLHRAHRVEGLELGVEVDALRRQLADAHRGRAADGAQNAFKRSEEHTSELQSLMRISYAVFCLKKKKPN